MAPATATATPPPRRRKLRVLVITMGSDRQQQIEAMFAHPSMARNFDPPSFTPGVPSRYLRNRLNLLRTANDAGILPKAEWDAIGTRGVELYDVNPDTIFDCLDGVPVAPGRRGSEKDRSLHYSIELWRKAKGLNRGRSILGCFLAHLIAMRRLVEEGYDMILEDNVRAPVGGIPDNAGNRPGKDAEEEEEEDGVENGNNLDSSAYCECANRIWQTIDASDALAASSGEECHLRYYGWLSTRTNLEWVMRTHAERTAYRPSKGDPDGAKVDGGTPTTVFPSPLLSEFNRDFPKNKDAELAFRDGEDDETAAAAATATGGKSSGTPIWGAYAYWISRTGLETLLTELQNDVGSVLWKGKRMRAYMVKPIDKVKPRKVMDVLGRDCVHVTTAPAFFRAPMLTSTIHAQWDAEFCRSTEYQMADGGAGAGAGAGGGAGGGRLDWNHLWLSEQERAIVSHRRRHGVWLTLAQLSSRKEDDDAKITVSDLQERMIECARVDIDPEGLSQAQEVCA